MSFYQKHVFICTNQKDDNRKCCAQSQALGLWSYTKHKLETLQLTGPGKIRVSRSGCLGRCAIGPCLVIYPDGIWYTYHNEQDIDEIISEHLQHQRVVTRLLLPEIKP